MGKVQNLLSRLISLSVFTGIFLFSQNAVAGGAPSPIGNMGIRAGVTAVPSLSGTMLIVLSLLLFIVAFRISKQKGTPANKFFVSLIGVIALSTSMGGIKVITDVNAGATVTKLTPGLTTVSVFLGDNFYKNEVGVDVTITSINITNPRYFCRQLAGADTPVCSATTGDSGNIIPPTKQCHLFCTRIPGPQ